MNKVVRWVRNLDQNTAGAVKVLVSCALIVGVIMLAIKLLALYNGG